MSPASEHDQPVAWQAPPASPTDPGADSRRWLLALIVGAVAIAVLLPLSIVALRAVVSFGA